MTNKEKRQIWDANLNPTEYGALEKQVKFKYKNLANRWVAPVRATDKQEKEMLEGLENKDDWVLGVQVKGPSGKKGYRPLKSHELSKTDKNKVSQQRLDNTRLFNLNEMKGQPEPWPKPKKRVKPSR